MGFNEDNKIIPIPDYRALDTSSLFEAYTRMLLITLWKGGYLHEILAFLLSTCLQDRSDPDCENEAWTPQAIYQKLSDIPLYKLCKWIENEYVSISGLPESHVSACFRLLYRKTDIQVREMINPHDQHAGKRWARIFEKSVSETTFNDYYGKNPSGNISNWTYNVSVRVKKFVVDNHWQERPFEELLSEIKSSNF